ncbi:MAG: L-threonylcarbamoyladenylate synthase [Actinomycetota bacterium]
MTPDLEAARDELLAGRPVVIPTDTVYGIAVMPSIAGAVQRVFDMKMRPLEKPMPVLGSEVESLRAVAAFEPLAEDLAARFWPGPLTLVLPRAAGFTDFLGGDTDAVAVRVPDRALTRKLLAATGPLAVTSANPSGAPPAATATEARAYFGDVLIVDDGAAGGMPSTVVKVDEGIEVLRKGSLSPSDLERRGRQD